MSNVNDRVLCFDMGDEYGDRYTVIYPDKTFIGMSEKPTHPQGIGIHGNLSPCYNMAELKATKIGDFIVGLGRRIEFGHLPEKCREIVSFEFDEIFI